MAQSIDGVAVSPAPTRGVAGDTNRQHDPAWAPIVDSVEPMRHGYRDAMPDARVHVVDDHAASFFFDGGSGAGDEAAAAIGRDAKG
jgi:hypothetical protein